jgi:hypothetical protein
MTEVGLTVRASLRRRFKLAKSYFSARETMLALTDMLRIRGSRRHFEVSNFVFDPNDLLSDGRT